MKKPPVYSPMNSNQRQKFHIYIEFFLRIETNKSIVLWTMCKVYVENNLTYFAEREIFEQFLSLLFVNESNDIVEWLSIVYHDLIKNRQHIRNARTHFSYFRCFYIGLLSSTKQYRTFDILLKFSGKISCITPDRKWKMANKIIVVFFSLHLTDIADYQY